MIRVYFFMPATVVFWSGSSLWARRLASLFPRNLRWDDDCPAEERTSMDATIKRVHDNRNFCILVAEARDLILFLSILMSFLLVSGIQLPNDPFFVF